VNLSRPRTQNVTSRLFRTAKAPYAMWSSVVAEIYLLSTAAPRQLVISWTSVENSNFSLLGTFSLIVNISKRAVYIYCDDFSIRVYLSHTQRGTESVSGERAVVRRSETNTRPAYPSFRRKSTISPPIHFVLSETTLEFVYYRFRLTVWSNGRVYASF
jgi:hypothetical protein